MKNVRLIIVNLIFVSILFSCSNNSNVTETKAPDSAIDVHSVKVELPAIKGVELVQGNCVPCHSLRYIEMQPDMNKKAWEKIVTKMIKVYKAPISDSLVAKQIVDYLTTIKGKK